MPKVQLPDGRVVDVPDDATPEQLTAFKAKLAQEFPQAQPKQEGNAVSRALQKFAQPVNQFAQTRQVPRPAGSQNLPIAQEDIPDAALRLPAAIVGGAAQFGSDLTSAPLKTLGNVAMSIGTSPYRAFKSFSDTGPAVAEGKFGEAGKHLGDSVLAAAEFGSLFAPAARVGKVGAASDSALASSLPKSTTKAIKQLTDADPDLVQSASRAARLQQEGIPVTTADLTSRNAISRIKGAARRDGPAQDIAQTFFDSRQSDQVARLTGDIERAFGVEGDFLARRAAIEETKKTASAPLYKAAHETPTKITPELTELLKRPPLQKAIAQAEEIAAIDGVRLNNLGKSGLPIVETRSGLGNARLGGDTTRLHYMRKALDDQIDVYRDKTTGKLVLDEKGRALVRLRGKFNAALRDGNPIFKEADDIWSGGTSLQEAMDRGVKAASMTTERNVRSFMESAVKAGDKEAFELGFAQGLTEMIGKSGSDMANGTLKLLSPERQKIVNTVLGPERGEALLNRVRVENLMARARQRISPNVGSDTAENLQQTASHAISMIASLAHPNPTHLAATGVKMLGKKKLAEKLIKEQRAVDEQLLRLATEDPNELLRLINEASRPRQATMPELNAGQLAGRALTSASASQSQLQTQ